jgi:hypothetical protein
MPKDKRPSPPVLLRFVQSLSALSDSHDIIQALEPCDIIKALDPFVQLLLRSTPIRIGARRIVQDHLGTCNT